MRETTPSNASAQRDVIVCDPALYRRLVAAVRRRFPRKSFGYLISDVDDATPVDFILFEENIRNDDRWRSRFESYGRYFVDHADAGFVATPEESWRHQQEIWARGMFEIGVFHSHQRHPGNFSRIDYDMHMQRFRDLWHVIISLRNPELPQVRAFDVRDSGVRELRIVAPGPRADRRDPGDRNRGDRYPGDQGKDAALAQARLALRLDREGFPVCRDARSVMTAVHGLLGTGDDDAIHEILTDGFLRERTARYEEFIAPLMRRVPPARFRMGSDPAHARHFFGETPCHAVELSAYEITRVTVTNRLLALLDPRRAESPAGEQDKPAVGVTWYEARLFGLWVDCRLPTEAEWEYACGAGGAGEWCCADESELPRHAWYSDNSNGEVRTVAGLEPNTLGLFDLHGNVWEWCHDAWDQDAYRRGRIVDPAIDPAGRDGGPVGAPDRICRGGSALSLAEMCRTRFRYHDPPGYHAADLGFRLARSPSTDPAHRRGESR